MGNSESSSSSGPSRSTSRPGVHRIADNYRSIEELQEGLRRAGLESSNLILGVDFTASNKWNGKRSFGGKSLHSLDPSTPNPYEQAISIIGKTLEVFDDDRYIPAYGFGCSNTGDKAVFSFLDDDKPCQGFQHVLARYREVVPALSLAGPTSFGELIRHATSIAAAEGDYHILVILADGQMTRSVDTPKGAWSPQEADTIDAIVAAARAPLSIVVVGIGDGPWDTMHTFDDNIPERAFDNFQFVEFNMVSNMLAQGKSNSEVEAAFALHALMEIPEQYQAIKHLKLLSKRQSLPRGRVMPPPPPARPIRSSTYYAPSGAPGAPAAPLPPPSSYVAPYPSQPAAAYYGNASPPPFGGPSPMFQGGGGGGDAVPVQRGNANDPLRHATAIPPQAPGATYSLYPPSDQQGDMPM